MAVKRSERLTVILSLAEKEAQDAAKIMEQARIALEFERHKLEDLIAYYNEYADSSSQKGKTVSVDNIARERSFLVHLADVQQQQEKLVAQHQQLVEQKKRNWQEKQLKFRALGDLVDRIIADENKVLSRKEEKLLDDWYLQISQIREGNWRENI